MLDQSPATRLDTVLGCFNDALERGDVDAAAALFDADSYWRDLVAFTWNIRTMEGQDQIREMLQAQLADAEALELRQDPGEASIAAGGVVEGWFTFETAVARGHGQLRLKDG